MKHTDDAYLAGILDGEGCVMISRKKSKRSRGGYAFALVVTVTNTCRPLLDHLCAVTGFGNIAPHSDSRPNMKQAWIWSLWSNQAKSVLCRVLPFLVVKKLQAELAIKFAATIRSGIGSKGLTKEELTERAQMYRTMRLLNRRGPNKDPIWMKNARKGGVKTDYRTPEQKLKELADALGYTKPPETGGGRLAASVERSR